MKRNSWIIGFILIIGLVVVGYNKAGAQTNDSPIAVVKQYFNAIVKKDAKTLHKLCINSEFASSIIPETDKMEIEKIKESLKTAKFEETINENEAIVEIIEKDGRASEVKLLKVDGKWKINQ